MGGDSPDVGLFTADKIERNTHQAKNEGATPPRGVIEIKSPSEPVQQTALSEQESELTYPPENAV